MSNKIYERGSVTISVPASQKIEVYAPNDGCKVYQEVSGTNHPTSWKLIGTVAAARQTFGTFSSSVANNIRIDAGADAIFYEVGTSPNVNSPYLVTSGGTESAGLLDIEMTANHATTANRAFKSRATGWDAAHGDLIGVYNLAEMSGGGTSAANSSICGNLSWVTINAGDTIGTGNVIAGYRAILDTAQDLQGVASGTNSALFYGNLWGTANGDCDFGVAIVNGLSGNTITSAFYADAAGAIVNLLEVDNVANVTNFANFNAVSGCVVANALVPATAPDASTMGADACLVIDIGGTPYYIPLYDTLHA